MNVLNFRVDKNTMQANENALVTTGNAEYVRCEFAFCSDWREMTKTAVFINGEDVINVLLEDDGCIIPSEALKSYGVCRVGVFGVLGTQRITTNFVPVKVNAGAYIQGKTPADPEADIWQQILAKIDGGAAVDSTVTADGTNAVSGAAVAAYVAANAGGGFRLLRRVTISEEVASVIITADEEGNPLSCAELALQAYLVPNTAADGRIVEVCGYVDGNTAKDYWFGYMGQAPTSGESISRAEINIRTGKSQKTYTTNLIPFNSTIMTNYSGQSELNALQNHSSVAWAYAPITGDSFITGIIIKGGSGSMLGAGCEFVIFGR